MWVQETLPDPLRKQIERFANECVSDYGCVAEEEEEAPTVLNNVFIYSLVGLI